ncbi:MAG TPA: ABC transporter substrate-binding protein [Candidatus Cybelea sp.]|nr:ABC transporter substrate-binding protein [Candidatus Cybelea sp.]
MVETHRAHRHTTSSRRTLWTAALGLAAFLGAAAGVHAEPGVSADKIVFGQAAPLNGPAAALGTGMRDGIQAAFAEANKAGGVKGHKLELTSVDDGYEPKQSIDATGKLINDSKVFALIGPVGTPTSMAVQPIVDEAKIPFIGPFTGAEGLRNPYRPLVVNVRASYFQETEVMVERLTKDLGYSKIAIFYQDDGYGRAGLDGVKRALAKRNISLVAEGTYERNTTAVKQAVLDIRKGEPQAVIMIGAYAPTAEFVKLAKQVKINATFVSISFVGTDALANALGSDGDGVVVTQVVPFPLDTSVPVVAKYQAALKAANPDAKPGYVSLEGYLVGRLAIEALGRVSGEPTRQALLDTVAKSGPFDLGGFSLKFSATDNQGSNQVYLTVIQADGSVKQVDSLKTKVSAAGGKN